MKTNYFSHISLSQIIEKNNYDFTYGKLYLPSLSEEIHPIKFHTIIYQKKSKR